MPTHRLLCRDNAPIASLLPTPEPSRHAWAMQRSRRIRSIFSLTLAVPLALGLMACDEGDDGDDDDDDDEDEDDEDDEYNWGRGFMLS